MFQSFNTTIYFNKKIRFYEEKKNNKNRSVLPSNKFPVHLHFPVFTPLFHYSLFQCKKQQSCQIISPKRSTCILFWKGLLRFIFILRTHNSRVFLHEGEPFQWMYETENKTVKESWKRFPFFLDNIYSFTKNVYILKCIKLYLTI